MRRRRDTWINAGIFTALKKIAGASRNDSPLLRPTLEKISRFGFFLPEQIGSKGHIANKCVPAPIQNTSRRFRKLTICTERRTIVIETFIALANTIIDTRRLIREA